MKERKKIEWNKLCNMFSLPLQLLFCLIGYFLIEAMSRHSVAAAYKFLDDHTWLFLYNSWILFMTTLPVYFIRHRTFYRVFISVFWAVLGIINGIVLANRVTPFTGSDLKLVSEGIGVLSKYFNVWQIVLLAIGLLILVVALIVMFIRLPKYKGKVHYILGAITFVVSIALFIGGTSLAFQYRLLSNYFGNIASAYEDYGYPYCLAITFFDTGISSPAGYSESLIKHIQKDEDASGEATAEDSQNPNIIVVQLESFFDPTKVRYLKMSEDPIPFFRSLSEEYSSGYFTVPAVGAGTANTEFETLTGMNMRYFGAGEYPYKTVLKDETCESAAYILDSLGYTSHAIHNNEANFYSRRTVYANLGFDTFTSKEFMAEQSIVTPLGWMKDSVLTSKINDCLDSTAGQDFVFTVSVQGHGAYPEEPTLENPEITVSGSGSEEKNNQWEYYVNEIHEMDQFIQNLVSMLEDRDEPTVLVLYGDHLPTMGLEEKDLKNHNLFQTRYVIWNNMGLEKQNKPLSAYQLMAEVTNQIGIHEGTMFRFHQLEKGSDLYQIDMETLQYDLLYGKQYVYDGVDPYERKTLQLGIKKTKLTGIQKITDSVYYLKGENFTPSVRITLNGEEIESTFLNTTTLLVQGQVFENNDLIGSFIKSSSATGTKMMDLNTIIYHPEN